MLDQRVQDQTTYLNEKYERLIADYEELCRVVMEMRSHMGGPYSPPFWPHGPDDDYPSPPPPPPSFF
jgi:hypothetical protein